MICIVRKYLIVFALMALSLNKAYNQEGFGRIDYYHSKVLDNNNHLDSWYKDENGPFEYIVGLSADWWKNTPEVEGWPIWCTAAEVDRSYVQSCGAIPGSACYFAIMACLKYYVHTGDTIYRKLAIKTGDYIVQQALTPSSFEKYHDFPYPVGKRGDIHPQGIGHPCEECTVNPEFSIQPDKGAMLGCALLELYKVTGKKYFLDASLNIANCLSENARTGTADYSPWPMRVMADKGETVDGDFAANVSFACRLFDELLRLGQIGNGKYQSTRNAVWNWLKNNVIIFDDASRWFHFFEDHSGSEINSTQINALETVRYLLENKENADPDWFAISGRILNQVARRWSVTSLADDGYVCIAEQDRDRSPYNSHTARYGSILALFNEAGGNAAYLDTAYHSLCYGLYSVENDGFTCTYFNTGDPAWTTDSFGDFLMHYMVALSANPGWCGNSNYLLKSTSTIREVKYPDEDHITYKVFDNSGTDKLKLLKKPVYVRVNGNPVNSYTWDQASNALIVNRSSGNSVEISLDIVDSDHGSCADDSSYKVYLNHTTGKLDIEIPEDTMNLIATVINLQGKVISELKLASLKTEVDLKNIAKGIYLVRIEGDNKPCTRKILIP
jgi:hypothetical protein